MHNLKSKKWWSAAGVRAIKTICQTAVATMSVATIWDVDIYALAGVVLMSGVMSLLTSLGGLPEVEEDK